MCNSRAEPLGVSGEMSGCLALKRFLKVLQIDAFDAGEAVGGCAGKEKNFARDGVLPKGLWGLGLRKVRGRIVMKNPVQTPSQPGPKRVPKRSRGVHGSRET